MSPVRSEQSLMFERCARRWHFPGCICRLRSLRDVRFGAAARILKSDRAPQKPGYVRYTSHRVPALRHDQPHSDHAPG